MNDDRLEQWNANFTEYDAHNYLQQKQHFENEIAQAQKQYDNALEARTTINERLNENERDTLENQNQYHADRQEYDKANDLVRESFNDLSDKKTAYESFQAVEASKSQGKEVENIEEEKAQSYERLSGQKLDAVSGGYDNLNQSNLNQPLSEAAKEQAKEAAKPIQDGHTAAQKDEEQISNDPRLDEWDKECEKNAPEAQKEQEATQTHDSPEIDDPEL